MDRNSDVKAILGVRTGNLVTLKKPNLPVFRSMHYLHDDFTNFCRFLGRFLLLVYMVCAVWPHQLFHKILGPLTIIGFSGICTT